MEQPSLNFQAAGTFQTFSIAWGEWALAPCREMRRCANLRSQASRESLAWFDRGVDFWQYTDTGLKLLQLRFYIMPTS